MEVFVFLSYLSFLFLLHLLPIRWTFALCRPPLPWLPVPAIPVSRVVLSVLLCSSLCCGLVALQLGQWGWVRWNSVVWRLMRLLATPAGCGTSGNCCPSGRALARGCSLTSCWWQCSDTIWSYNLDVEVSLSSVWNQSSGKCPVDCVFAGINLLLLTGNHVRSCMFCYESCILRILWISISFPGNCCNSSVWHALLSMSEFFWVGTNHWGHTTF